MSRLDQEPIRTVLGDLHARADDNDGPVMERVMQTARERKVRSDLELSDVLADAYMPISPANGGLLHVLAAARRPGRIVEFGTSMGLSTIYLAAALDNDEPPLIATEMEPHKVVSARRNIDAAGLADRVDLRQGDAFETLVDLDEPISLLFLDGWKGLYLSMVRLLEPLLVDGAFVIADDTTLLPELCQPFLDYVRHEGSSFVSTELPLDDGLELCVHRVS